VLHAAVRYKRPVYLELPRDLVTTPGRPITARAICTRRAIHHGWPGAGGGDDAAEQGEAAVILAMFEVTASACRRVDQVSSRNRHPVAATILGKSSWPSSTRSISACTKARWGATMCASM